MFADGGLMHEQRFFLGRSSLFFLRRSERRGRQERGIALRDFRAVFRQLPSALLVLRADAPAFTIVAANDAYLRSTMTQRSGPTGLVGRGLGQLVSDSSTDRNVRGSHKLLASLRRVVDTGAPDRMGIQRHDIQRQDGTWEERFWTAWNVPIRDSSGDVQYVVHQLEDVTSSMRSDRRLTAAEQAAAIAERANAAKADFLAAMVVPDDIRDNCGLVTYADPEKTRQILLNLLSNAVKFTDTGGGSSRRSCRSAIGVVATAEPVLDFPSAVIWLGRWEATSPRRANSDVDRRSR
jgi:hypothetical protein